jgi:hypothetical protein
MALYLMGFGGTIPLGLLAAGAVASHTSVTVVVAAGGVIAALLALGRFADTSGRRSLKATTETAHP